MDEPLIFMLVVGGSLALMILIDALTDMIPKKRRETMPKENTYMVCFESKPYDYERRFMKATSAQEAVDLVAQEKKDQGKTIDCIQVFKRMLPSLSNAEIQYYWKPSKEVTE